MKLKKLLNENLWNERKFGEPLPTLADTTRAYKLKQEDLNENQDVKKLASMLGFKEFAVKKFIDKYKDLEADDLIETEKRLHKIADYISQKKKDSGVKVLWGTANCFSNPIYMNGAATNPDFEVGEKVQHKEFGSGTILGISDKKLQIRFENSDEVIKVFSDFVSKL